MTQNTPLHRFVVVAGIIAVGVGSLTAVFLIWSDYQSTSRRRASHADLKQIGLALHQYHDQYQSFPPAFQLGSDGRRWHSWRALILPYLDPELARQYRFDEPWDGPNNSRLHAIAPASLQGLSVNKSLATTKYFAVVGQRTLWPAHQALAIKDIVDGTSNTIAVVEDVRTDILWLEPRDLLQGELFRSFDEYQRLNLSGGRHLLFADGSVRFVRNSLDKVLLASLLTPHAFQNTFQGDDWPADLLDTVTKQTLGQPIDANSLHQTDVSAVSTTPLTPGRSQIWSAAFQMAWDQLRKLGNGNVDLLDPNILSQQLNASTFDSDNISAKAMIVRVTDGTDEEDAKLISEIRQKFPEVTPELTAFPEIRDWTIRLFALIRKTMPFEKQFERFSKPLEFHASEAVSSVQSFGYDPTNASDAEVVFQGQLEILDDRSDKDFVLSLQTVGPQQDQIIIAMMEPGETLDATWKLIQDRILHPNPQHQRRNLEGHETLQIPILNFCVQKRFHELEQQKLRGFSDPARIGFALMDIRLRLDETGADFLSIGEAGVIGENGHTHYDPGRIRRFVLNGPFLIGLKERTASEPYFLGWIANSELMELSR